MQDNLLPPRIVIVQNLVLNEPILSHIQNIVGPEIVQVSKICPGLLPCGDLILKNLWGRTTGSGLVWKTNPALSASVVAGPSADYCIMLLPGSGCSALSYWLSPSFLPVTWLCCSWYSAPLKVSFLCAVSTFPGLAPCDGLLECKPTQGGYLFILFNVLPSMPRTLLAGVRLSINICWKKFADFWLYHFVFL